MTNHHKLPIKLQHEGFRVEIKNTKQSSCNLRNMRDGKIFLDDNKYKIFLDDTPYEVKEFDVFDLDNNPIPKADFICDTTTRVSGIVLFKNKVLLLHRKKKGREYYVFPGGHLKTHETDMDGVIREIKEETNIDLKDPHKFLELENEGYGHEIFLVEKITKPPPDIFEFNPEVPKGEKADITWLDIHEASKLDNLHPHEVRDKLLNIKNAN